MVNFKDYPDFKPNLTPRQMFRLGSFGGTYWRPIYSDITKENYKNVHKEFPNSWWKNIPEHHLSSSNYDISINKYKVKVGTTYHFGKKRVGFINKIHMDGFYGIVDFIKGVEHLMIKDRLEDGKV